MFDELNKYRINGHFFFSKGDALAEASTDVPDAPGVYYILRLSKGHVDLVYIGKSGTVRQDSTFRDQLLRGRINNHQQGISRQQYFDQKMEEEEIEALDIYWFVTYDDKTGDLPSYVEGLIMQRYFETYGCLPPWNKEF